MQVPHTSIEAYEKKKTSINSDHSHILSAMSNKDNRTYREIAYLLSCEPTKVSRRMSELVSLNKIKVDTIRKCSIGGRNCMAYLKCS